jgi:renalase
LKRVLNSQDSSPILDCVILGAGMAGLCAGASLMENGKDINILEKSRGLGGRLATRRVNLNESSDQQAYFDHGIQFLEFSNSDSFQGFSHFLGPDRIQQWDLKSSSSFKVLRPLPGMSSVGKSFPSATQVLIKKKVTQINYQQESESWIVSVEDQSEYRARQLISTMPVPQMIEILSQSFLSFEHESVQRLMNVRYLPCITLLIILKEETQFHLMRNPDSALELLIENKNKGISKEVPCLTVVASGEWSKIHFLDSSESIFENLWKICKRWIPGEVLRYEVHRWKYSQPVNNLSNLIDRPFMRLHSEGVPHVSSLTLCGDAFGSAELKPFERAIVSGQAGADQVLQCL